MCTQPGLESRLFSDARGPPATGRAAPGERRYWRRRGAATPPCKRPTKDRRLSSPLPQKCCEESRTAFVGFTSWRGPKTPAGVTPPRARPGGRRSGAQAALPRSAAGWRPSARGPSESPPRRRRYAPPRSRRGGSHGVAARRPYRRRAHPARARRSCGPPARSRWREPRLRRPRSGSGSGP